MKKGVRNVTFVKKVLLKITLKKNVDVNYSAIKAAMANVICKFLFLVQVSILSQQILSVYVYIVSKFFFNCCAFFFLFVI